MTKYEKRHEMELLQWEEFMIPFSQLQMVCYADGELESKFKFEMFTVLSASHGCAHCQAHGGFALSRFGLKPERIRALWTFETSDEFSAAEKVAYRFCQAAASCPNEVTPDHHAELKKHYNVLAVREILAVIAFSGLLNRYSDTVAVVTDHSSANWAAENLSEVGWSIGKHQGDDEERRPDL